MLKITRYEHDGSVEGERAARKLARTKAWQAVDPMRMRQIRRDCHERRVLSIIPGYKDRPEDMRCQSCGDHKPGAWGREGRSQTLVCDHDHITGEFRGWLCTNCNIALGQLQDSPDRLKKLLRYLEKTGG